MTKLLRLKDFENEGEIEGLIKWSKIKVRKKRTDYLNRLEKGESIFLHNNSEGISEWYVFEGKIGGRYAFMKQDFNKEKSTKGDSAIISVRVSWEDIFVCPEREDISIHNGNTKRIVRYLPHNSKYESKRLMFARAGGKVA